jgi:DNA-binding transcriptional ArsR family regulator
MTGFLRLRLDLYFVEWLIGNMSNIQTLRALANERRLQILSWLKDPVAHFPPQADGDLRKDGVCGLFIAEKLGLSQPTASEHLRILTQAGLVRAKRIKQWTFYQRDEGNIRKLKQSVMKSI